MTVQNTEGIILRKYYLRETSFILVVFTKEFGKIKGVIKGVRGVGTHSSGDYEIFNRCDFLFYKKKRKSMDLITRCEALECFMPIRKDIERLTFANYFIELIDIVVVDTLKDSVLYDVLVESIQMLATAGSAKRTARIFELKLLNRIGLSPQLDECVVCGRSAEMKMKFDISLGGVVCFGCKGTGAYLTNVSMGSLNFMRKVQRSDMSLLSRIKVSKDVGMESERILVAFLKYRVNRPIRSLVFMQKLDKWGVLT